MAHILVFGTSITYGAWDAEGGWVQRLRKFLDEKQFSDPGSYFILYNLGISGDTVEGILERFESETRQRIDEEEETIFIFDIGLNDSQFLHSKGALRFSPDQFRANVTALIAKARKFSQKMVFVGPTPVDEPKVDPMPWAEDKSYKNGYVDQFNTILESVCIDEQIPFVNIFKIMKSRDYNSLLKDGAHPNSDGHKIMFEIVKDFLLQNKMI